jgi:hypothetical protein
VDTTLRELRKHVPQVAEQFASARSAANLRTRRKDEREEETRVRRSRRATQRRLREQEREAATWFRGRVRVKVDEPDRPRVGLRTSRKLHSRDDPNHIIGKIGSPVVTGPDGCQSVHYQFLARGLAGSKGKPWLPGEAGRKYQYITRYEALEDGTAGWWSNIGEDRAELTAFGRVLEALERHDRKNANVFCEEIIALPCELSPAQRRECVEHICFAISARGLPFAVGIHKPDPKGDQRNFHCHLVYSLRPARRLEEYHWDFEAQKVSDINTPVGIRARREAVTTALNVALAKAGIAKRYTDKSHAARGIKTPPGRKRGQALTAIYRKRQADQEAAAEGPAVTASIERKIVTARDVAKLASDAAASLEEARATLQATRAAVRGTVIEMQETVQSATARARETATLAKDAIDQMQRRRVEQITAACARLDAARAHISLDIRLVRSAVAKAGMDFSQIDHPDHLEKAMRLSQSKALEPQAPAPAPTEPRSLAADSSASVHKPPAKPASVSALEQTLKGHGSIFDVRSLDDEVAEPPVAGSKDDINKTLERTPEQSSSGDSAPAVDKAKVYRGDDESEAMTSLGADGGTNSSVAPPQSRPRELTPETPAVTPTTPQPMVAASRKPQEIEGYVPIASFAEFEAQEAEDAKREAEAKAKAEAEAKEKAEAEERARRETEAKAAAAERAAQAERDRLAAETKAKEEAAAKARAKAEAERTAQAERERLAAEAKATAEAEERARRETEAKAAAAERAAQAERDRLTAEATAKAEAAAKAKAEAERTAKLERDRLAAEAKSQAEAEERARGEVAAKPAAPAQSPSISGLTPEALTQLQRQLLRQEIEIQAAAAKVPVDRFARYFTREERAQVSHGAGLPADQAKLLAEVEARLERLQPRSPEVALAPAPPVQPAQPAPTGPTPQSPVPSLTPRSPAPEPGFTDEEIAMGLASGRLQIVKGRIVMTRGGLGRSGK